MGKLELILMLILGLLVTINNVVTFVVGKHYGWAIGITIVYLLYLNMIPTKRG